MTVTDVDPAAPYGYRIDGVTPKRAPGGRPPGPRGSSKPTGPRRSSGARTGKGTPYEQILITDDNEGDQVSEQQHDGPELVDVEGLDPEPERRPTQGPTMPPGRARPRITVAIRKDVTAKLKFMLMLPATVWAAADPYCGKSFSASVPELADALADVVCDSADLLAWFTSGGNYMTWLKLTAVLQPTAVLVWQHHIAHTIGDNDDDERTGFDPTLYPSAAGN